MRIEQPGLRPRRGVSFEGCHNGSKVKTFIVLSSSEVAKRQDGWLTGRQIAWLTGLSYGSLLSLLPKWTRWKYVERKKFRLLNSPQTAYGYKLDRGFEYLAAHEDRIPWERYEREMAEDRERRGYL